MTSELCTTDTVSVPSAPAAPGKRRVQLAAVAVVGALALTACNSDPGRKRVAEDIIRTAVVEGDLTQAEGDCMFDRVETYSEEQLEAIAASADDAGPGTLIQQYEADLAACKE